MAITPPPKKETAPEKKTNEATDKKIREFIGKGGTTAESQPGQGADVLKNINIRIYQTEIESINALRSQRPRPRSGKKPGISLHDWIVEAIQEKIGRDNAKPA